MTAASYAGKSNSQGIIERFNGTMHNVQHHTAQKIQGR